MKNNLLIDISKSFAVDIINLCTQLRENRKGMTMTSQILRSGTSIGANIREANYASGRVDFINKMQIALKECYETEYWLELFEETDIISEKQFKSIYIKCGKIRRLLIASINTAKNNSQ